MAGKEDASWVMGKACCHTVTHPNYTLHSVRQSVGEQDKLVTADTLLSDGARDYPVILPSELEKDYYRLALPHHSG